MPKEYINYTITDLNGTLWAAVDGCYPIYLQGNFTGDLPIVYPMPPQTTNISISLNNEQLSWGNLTQSYPWELHHTTIGDWWMIYTQLSNVSDFFELKIHYEHPLETVNGSYLFLYDLNISPYLSPQSNRSTAYFTICMEANTTDLKVYTALPDGKWNPIDFTLKEENATSVVGVEMVSEYSKPLLGDLIVTFPSSNQAPELPALAFLPLLLVLLFVVVLMKHRRTAILSE
ncbi:MAG: hypothetical protein ACQCN6_14060 [Candidatus Bathyarchaeia archaeon]